MRERIAVAVSVLAVTVLIGLSAIFARAQNPAAEAVTALPVPEAPLPSPEAAEADTLRGREVFLASGCTSCHSVAGAGSPRYPLDGVGARRTAAELRAWTIAPEAMADSLAPSAFRAKQRYQELAAEDLDALIAYLASLR